MLLQLWTGKKPDKAMHRMVGFYLCGWADADELLAFINRPDNTGVKLRQREELFKKLGW